MGDRPSFHAVAFTDAQDDGRKISERAASSSIVTASVPERRRHQPRLGRAQA